MSDQTNPEPATGYELYGALVVLCQQYGVTTGATYDLLHEVVASVIAPDD